MEINKTPSKIMEVSYKAQQMADYVGIISELFPFGTEITFNNKAIPKLQGKTGKVLGVLRDNKGLSIQLDEEIKPGVSIVNFQDSFDNFSMEELSKGNGIFS